MVKTLIIGITGIIGLMILWIIVQYYWRNTFFEDITDEDVLAGRSSCGSCGCGSICKKEIIE